MMRSKHSYFVLIPALAALSGCTSLTSSVTATKASDYKPIVIKKEQVVTVRDVIDLVSGDIEKTGRYHVTAPARNASECAVDLYVSPKSFKVSLKTSTNFEVDGSIGAPLPIAIVVTPSITLTHKSITTQQIDTPFDMILQSDPQPLPQTLQAWAVDDGTENTQKVLQKTLLTILTTYRDMPHPLDAQGKCDRYADPIVFTSAFQVENSVGGEVKAVPVVTLDGKMIGSSDAYQTVEITYAFSSTAAPAKPPAGNDHPLIFKFGTIDGLAPAVPQAQPGH